MAQKTKQYTAEYVSQKVDEYLAACTKKDAIPILKECCLENGWSYCYIEQLKQSDPDIAKPIKKLLDTKEVALEKRLYSNAPATGTIFSLKQMGWKDNPQIMNALAIEQPKEKPAIDFSHVDRNIIGQIADLYDKLDDLLEEAHRQQDAWAGAKNAPISPQNGLVRGFSGVKREIIPLEQKDAIQGHYEA